MTLRPMTDEPRKLTDLVDTFVMSHGGTGVNTCYGRKWSLPSKWGVFEVSIHNPSTTLTIYGRFVESERAAGQLGFGGPNPCTGVYNSHFGYPDEGATAESAFNTWALSMQRVVLWDAPSK